jgi:hypothetical protein
MNKLARAILTASSCLWLAACPAAEQLEGIGRVDELPSPIRADYEVFAQRCSKCHSLARPLNSGIDNDEFWAMYVARMKRQPGSGISTEDTVVILRFLSFYSREQKKRRSGGESSASAGVDASLAEEASVP